MDITIKEALDFLDPADDANWTADGLPRMDVVERLVDDKAITRQDVTDADPEFCREVAHDREAVEVVMEETSGLLETQEEEEVATKFSLDQQIQDINEDIVALEKTRDALVRERDRLQELEFGGHTAADDTKARLAYVKKQHELRLERAGRRANILNMIGPGDAAKGSQLDAAMGRKRARGTERPVRPPQ